MNWKLFWKVVRISFGVVILITAVVMLFYSLFCFDSIDIAYCMFSILSILLGVIMVLFGISSLPNQDS